MSRKLLKLNPLLAAGWLLAASVGQTAQRAEFRTWTGSTGEHQVDAAFVDFQNGQVRLKKPDGQLLSLPVETLSQYDRQYLRLRESGSPVVEVAEAMGAGLDPDTALQNAYTNAIEQAVGVLVAGKTTVKDDELIQDEILTYSRGYVEHFDVIQRKEQDGQHRCTIRALVAHEKLTEKLKSQGIAVVRVPGALIIRQIRHELASERDAAEMLREVMLDCAMDKLVKVEVLEGPSVIQRDAAEATFRVRLKLSADMAVWEQFRQELRPLLERVAGYKASLEVEGREELNPPQPGLPGMPPGLGGPGKGPGLGGVGRGAGAGRPGRGPAGTPPGRGRGGFGPVKGPQVGKRGPMTLLGSSQFKGDLALHGKLAIQNPLPGEAVTLLLLKTISNTGHRTTWDHYVILESIAGDALNEARGRRFELCVRLVDQDNRTVAEVRPQIPEPFAKAQWSFMRYLTTFGRGGNRQFMDRYAIAPLFWFGSFGVSGLPGDQLFQGSYSRAVAIEATLPVRLDDVERVANCTASIEEVRLE